MNRMRHWRLRATSSIFFRAFSRSIHSKASLRRRIVKIFHQLEHDHLSRKTFISILLILSCQSVHPARFVIIKSANIYETVWARSMKFGTREPWSELIFVSNFGPSATDGFNRCDRCHWRANVPVAPTHLFNTRNGKFENRKKNRAAPLWSRADCSAMKVVATCGKHH